MTGDLASLVRRAEAATVEAERLADVAAETRVQAMPTRAEHQLIDVETSRRARAHELVRELAALAARGEPPVSPVGRGGVRRPRCSAGSAGSGVSSAGPGHVTRSELARDGPSCRWRRDGQGVRGGRCRAARGARLLRLRLLAVAFRAT
jgi:hypothetical protein